MLIVSKLLHQFISKDPANFLIVSKCAANISKIPVSKQKTNMLGQDALKNYKMTSAYYVRNGPYTIPKATLYSGIYR